MSITVELLFENTDTYMNVTRIDRQGDFIIIDYKQGHRDLQKIYLASQVIKIECMV